MSINANLILKILISLVVILIIATLGVLGYQYYDQMTAVSETNEVDVDNELVEVPPFDPGGYIIMNLTNDTGERRPYVFSFESSAITRLPGDFLYPHFTDNERSYIATIHTASTTHLGAENIYSHLYETNIETKEDVILLSKPRESGVGEFRRPRISSTGDYYTLEISPIADPKSITYYYLDDWNIYLGQKGEEPQLIANGAFANFVPGLDRNLIYLASDGVHYIEFQGEGDIYQDNLIIEAAVDNVLANNHLTLSRDGKRFVVSDIEGQKIMVVTVKNWFPFEVSEIKRYDMAAFWPTFSPDGRYIAVQEVDIQAAGEGPASSWLTIIDLFTDERVSLANFSDYVQTELFISDWIKNLPDNLTI